MKLITRPGFWSYAGLAVVMIVLATVLPSVTSADVIHLETGGRIVGKVIREGADQVVIQPRIGGQQSVPRDDIASIEYGEVEATPAPRRAPAPKAPAPEAAGTPEAGVDQPPARGHKPRRERTPRPARRREDGAERWSSRHDKVYSALVKRLFDPGSQERKAVIEEAAALPVLPRTRLKRLTAQAFKAAYGGPRSEVGSVTRTLKDSRFPGEFHVYGEARGQRSLVIGLHGGGQGSGDGANSAQKWSFTSGLGALCAFPTVLEKVDVAWNREDNEQYVIALIDELKRTYHVDTNRVYLVGHSMGGFGTWSIGSHYADRFAAISPNAGGLWGRGKLPNLHNTPVYFYHSTDDARVPPGQDQEAARTLKKLAQEHGGYEHHYEEYTDIGHGMPREGLRPIVDWLMQHTRDPYPSKVVFEPSRSYKRTLYWLRSEGGQGRVVAEWQGNTLSVRGPDSGYTVFLHPRLVDMDEEVVVMVNDRERFRGVVRPSAAALLDSVAEHRDPAMFFTGRVDIR